MADILRLAEVYFLCRKGVGYFRNSCGYSVCCLVGIFDLFVFSVSGCKPHHSLWFELSWLMKGRFFLAVRNAVQLATALPFKEIGCSSFFPLLKPNSACLAS